QAKQEKDHERYRQEIERGDGKMQEGIVVTLEEFLGGNHQILLHADHRQGKVDDGGGVEQEDDFIGIGWPGEPDEVRPDDTTKLLGPRHAVGACGFHLAARYRAKGAIEYLGRIG